MGSRASQPQDPPDLRARFGGMQAIVEDFLDGPQGCGRPAKPLKDEPKRSFAVEFEMASRADYAQVSDRIDISRR